MPPSIVEPLQFSANFDSLIPAPLSRIPPEVDFPLLEGTVTGLGFGQALVALVFWKRHRASDRLLRKRIPKKEVCGRGTSCINAITRSKHEASILSTDLTRTRLLGD
jgi:hypothetical protein